MDNNDKIIEQVFQNEIQLKRIRKEKQLIDQLDQSTQTISWKQSNTNLSIIIELYPFPNLNSNRPIKICIYLDNKFPFVFPKIHLLSHLTKPTLADGRDYIQNILQQQWSPSILLKEIITKLPEFIKSIEERQHDRNYLLSLGEYHKGIEYDGTLGFEDVEYFQCKEVINGKQVQRTLQLSSSYVLILEQSNKAWILIDFMATKDIKSIEKQQTAVLITWATIDENYKQQTIYPQNQDQFIESLKAYKAGSSGKKILENDVTMQKFETFQIENLLNQIQEQEIELENNLTQDTLNQLMSSYQKAIEYYSAYSDEDYKQYVTKLQIIVGREAVQQLLNNIPQ